MSKFDDARKNKRNWFDGVMLGRAIFGNPWLFASKEYILKQSVSASLRSELLGSSACERLL